MFLRDLHGHVAWHARLRDTITDQQRLAVLRIKDVWHRLPSYPEQVSGWSGSDRHRSGPALQAVILPGGDDSSPEVARGAGSTGRPGLRGSQGQGAWVSAGGGERAEAGDAVDDETGPADVRG